jgi:hypothetical protein
MVLKPSRQYQVPGAQSKHHDQRKDYSWLDYHDAMVAAFAA